MAVAVGVVVADGLLWLLTLLCRFSQGLAFQQLSVEAKNWQS